MAAQQRYSLRQILFLSIVILTVFYCFTCNLFFRFQNSCKIFLYQINQMYIQVISTYFYWVNDILPGVGEYRGQASGVTRRCPGTDSRRIWSTSSSTWTHWNHQNTGMTQIKKISSQTA